MSGTRYVLDTSAALDLLAGSTKVASLVDEAEIYLSAIARVELLCALKSTPAHDAAIASFLVDCRIIEFTNHVQDATVQLRRKYKLKLPDAAIAATAAWLKAPLITADKAFARIDFELEVVLLER